MFVINLTSMGAYVGEAYLITLDIEDFFPSINSLQTRQVFLVEPFSFPKPMAASLSRLCTYEDRLPQGAPTSPIISNFIFLSLDAKISDFCNLFNITYPDMPTTFLFRLKSLDLPKNTRSFIMSSKSSCSNLVSN